LFALRRVSLNAPGGGGNLSLVGSFVFFNYAFSIPIIYHPFGMSKFNVNLLASGGQPFSMSPKSRGNLAQVGCLSPFALLAKSGPTRIELCLCGGKS